MPNDIWTGEQSDLWHVFPTDERDRHELTGTNCPCNPRIETRDTIIVVHNSWDGREAVEIANDILNPLKDGMQRVTPEQGEAVADYIEETFNVDLEEELKRGEEAQKGLVPFVEHLLRMGASCTRFPIFANGKEYELSISITPAERSEPSNAK